MSDFIQLSSPVCVVKVLHSVLRVKDKLVIHTKHRTAVELQPFISFGLLVEAQLQSFLTFGVMPKPLYP
jgi:hypothetical protein